MKLAKERNWGSPQLFLQKVFPAPEGCIEAGPMDHWGAGPPAPQTSVLAVASASTGKSTAPQETPAGPEPTRFQSGLAYVSSEPSLCGGSRDLIDFSWEKICPSWVAPSVGALPMYTEKVVGLVPHQGAYGRPLIDISNMAISFSVSPNQNQ